MKQTTEPLPSFKKPWKEFSGAWKKARSEASEKFIHDLRVSTRRLIARLELTRAISKNEEIAAVQKQFKKVLKRMGPLRDVQVQLEGLERFRTNGIITDFKQNLKRRENASIKSIRRDLKSEKRRGLKNAIANLSSDFEILVEAHEDDNVRRSIEQVVRLRRSEFFKARRQFKPGNDETLHQMRIALKKLRYVVEGAHPILGDWAKESADEMHAYQQLMGDARDIEILRAHLQKWAAKRGKLLAVIPVLDRLAQKRARLIKSIAKSSDMLEHIFPIRNSGPYKERTRTAAQSQRRSELSPTVEPATGQRLSLVPIRTNTSRTISR